METLVAGFDRFLVALAALRDLLIGAKHLFFAAMVTIAPAAGSRMSNGLSSALNSEQDLASIPMAQGSALPATGYSAPQKARACRWRLRDFRLDGILFILRKS
jgi:hypothetical protein